MALFQRIVLGLSLCFLALLGYVVPLTERGRAATGEAVEEYYRRYNAGDFNYILASLLTPGAAEYSSAAAMRTAYGKLGKYTAKTRKSFKLLDLKGNRWSYRFDASYEKGPAADSFVLVRDQAGFRLENLPNSAFSCSR